MTRQSLNTIDLQQKRFQEWVNSDEFTEQLNSDLKSLLDGLRHLPVEKQFGIMLGIQNIRNMAQSPYQEV